MSEPERCQIRMPRRAGGGVCNRLLTNPCRYCHIFDKCKDDWVALYQELEPPRMAVEGDI